MPSTINGLPIHPLLVHVAVVFIPLAAVGLIAIVLVPRWRERYQWLVLIAATLVVVLVPIVTKSGFNLKHSLNLGGPVLDKVRTHQRYGSKMIYVVLPMWLLTVAWIWLQRQGRKGVLVGIVGGLGVVAALTAIVLVVLTGDAGARAVWNPTG